MIYVITAVPGSGKTLFAIDFVRGLAEKEGRPVFYSGIADLKLPWIEHDPTKWEELPPGGIMVIDECQRVFRPRANGSTVPPYIAAMETHRHKGIDLVLITQHPMLIDGNIRRLTGKHFHLKRIFGSHSATVMEWGQIKENPDKSNADAFKRTWKYPKDVFELYKSAEVHTHKLSLPRQFYYLIALVLVFALGVFYLINKHSGDDQVEAKPKPPDSPAPSTSSARPAPAADRFVADYNPRVQGLAYTAPAYDQVTRPTRAPLPVACVATQARCQCYTQQGTRLATTDQICRDIVAGGFFVAFDEREQGRERGRVTAPAVALASPDQVGAATAEQHVSLGGAPNTSRMAAAPARSRPTGDQ